MPLVTRPRRAGYGGTSSGYYNLDEDSGFVRGWKMAAKTRRKFDMRSRAVSYWGREALLVLSVCGWLAARPAFGETYLVKDGKPGADIVIADKPPRMAKLAAEELQTYVEKISGAKLAITNAPGSDAPAHIYVGRSAETDKLKISDEGLKHGAFKMVSGENWLALLGHDSDYTPPMPFYDRAFCKMVWSTGLNAPTKIRIHVSWTSAS